MYQKLANYILTLDGGNLQSNQKNILDEINNLKLVDEHDKIAAETEVISGGAKEKKEITKSVSDYNTVNMFKFLNSHDGRVITSNTNNYLLNEFESAFDKNVRTGMVQYRDYQKKFIEDWSVSLQELVILYYGVGTGKTLIAVNCAEQFILLNNNSKVYFVLPASLVLGTIIEFYKKGIDAGRMNKKGEYIYNFISYQQILLTKFDFDPNSLLIVDEVHNLRNIKSSEINDKISARKWKKTDSYSLVGNKLAESLIYNSQNFIRKLFITGTLFVNSAEDIEPIIALGYSKAPLLDFNKTQYELILGNNDSFKTYFEGLISYYKIEGETKAKMPTIKYDFVTVYSKSVGRINKEDPFFINSRNNGNTAKLKYILDFLLKNKNQRTLIFSQFLQRALEPLLKRLTREGIRYGYISGSLSMEKKLEQVNKYNSGQLNILIFTLSIKEGISFLETDNIIIEQPYWNWSIMAQVIARGIRLNSHKKGYKSIINVNLLVGVNDDKDKNIIRWINNANNIMNKDILKIEIDDKNDTQFEIYNEHYKSRDIYLYNINFRKQSQINIFEKRLLKLPKFEDVNNSENNDFIKFFNNEVIDQEARTKKKMTLKEEIFLKRRMYADFYKLKINETNNNITRLTNDSKLRYTRGPDLIETSGIGKIIDIDKIEKLIDSKASLAKIFASFGIDKQTITRFQANFTPPSLCKKLIEISGIEKDTRLNIKVLEPTAGIGNMVSELIKLKNASSFAIDANEIFSLYYQIGKILYKNIDNIVWYNLDYTKYYQKYNYHYIIGNPPFNLNLSPKGKDRREHIVLYDIDFVAMAYNQLVEGGVLAFIISNKFTKCTPYLKYNNFKKYIDIIKKENDKNVIIENLTHGFDVEDETKTTKSQKTDIDMVYIRLVKVGTFVINLTVDPDDEKKKKRTKKVKKDEDEEINIDEDEINIDEESEQEPEPDHIQVPEPEPEPEPKPKPIKIKKIKEPLPLAQEEPLVKIKKIKEPLVKIKKIKEQILTDDQEKELNKQINKVKNDKELEKELMRQINEIKKNKLLEKELMRQIDEIRKKKKEEKEQPKLEEDNIIKNKKINNKIIKDKKKKKEKEPPKIKKSKMKPTKPPKPYDENMTAQEKEEWRDAYEEWKITRGNEDNEEYI